MMQVSDFRVSDGSEQPVQFVLQPVFIGWITLLTQLPIQLFMTLWAGGFFGGLTSILIPHSPAPFVLFGGAAFFGIPLFTYFGKKLNYARTRYTFYPDRLEFEEGFFSINKKVIRFRDVKEVSLHKGILPRLYGLGTIYLATLATGSSPGTNVFSAFGFGNISASGVGVRDIRNPDAEFDRIRHLVDTSNRIFS
jgi:membrane protein YdbS with pleckstrin-like domain